jgi:hypothetical protein
MQTKCEVQNTDGRREDGARVYRGARGAAKKSKGRIAPAGKTGMSSLINDAFLQQHPDAVAIVQTPIDVSSRSNPPTYTGIMDDVLFRQPLNASQCSVPRLAETSTHFRKTRRLP